MINKHFKTEWKWGVVLVVEIARLSGIYPKERPNKTDKGMTKYL